MAESKELHYCEGCKKEQWFTIDQVLQKGSICVNGCTRNKLVYFGVTKKEIEKRKKTFFETNGFDFEVKFQVEEGSEDEDGLRFRRKPSSERGKSEYPW